MATKQTRIRMAAAVFCLMSLSAAGAEYRVVQKGEVECLSVLLSPELPCWWPGLPEYQCIPYHVIGPAPSRSNLTIIDEHTGTHFDAPAHWIPPLKSGLPHATVYGEITNEKVPVWQFMGEACVIDVSGILNQAPDGKSPIITRAMVEQWERQHRRLAAGDVVIFASGYDDQYYKPLPQGRRLIAEPLEGKAPSFPGPDGPCMEYLVERGIRHIAIDSPSLGPAPGGDQTHWSGLGAGAIFTELLAHCGSLPATGTFFAFLPVKLAGASGGPGRAIAITEPALAGKLIQAAKQQRVADLSLVNGPDYPDYWVGGGAGNNMFPHTVAVFNRWDGWRGPYFTQTHLIDAHTGTHFDPPSHFLPNPGFDNRTYDEWTQGVLKDYEGKYGPRGTSEVFAADYPLHQMMGPARVIDVMGRIGTTASEEWPKSPEIRVEDIKTHEQLYGPIQAGDVVLFKTGWSDRYYLPGVYGQRVGPEAIDGKAEGWPAPNVEAILYLAEKDVACVGIDAPSVGAVTGRESVQVHWAGFSQGMNYVEFLTGLGGLPPQGAFFIFLPLKQKGVPGGIGRAVAILP